MNVKDVIEVAIEDSGMDGEGVCRVDGKVVFVPYTLKGERVRAVVRGVKKRYAAASVIKVLEPSEFRAEPRCPHYYRCGGCDMLHVTPEYRRRALTDELSRNLKKIAGRGIADIGFTETPPPLPRAGVRNKLSMPFARIGGKAVLGFYRHGTHTVEPVDCAMSGSITREIVAAVLGFVNARNISVYYEDTGEGLLRHLVVREIGDRASATLVINGKGLGADSERELAKKLPDAVDLFISPNTRRGNVIMGESARLVKGVGALAVDVLGVRAELFPLSFFQVNNGIRDALYAAAIGEVRSKVLVDLYSGIGITSNLAAKKCDHVYAIELVPAAVADADRTAELNGNANKITNICGAVDKTLSEIADRIVGADVLVDPPRKGCGESVMNGIAARLPNKLIYISCDHATMCRDIKLFNAAAASHGAAYSLDRCDIFDMFAGTHHCEVLAVLSRMGQK